MKCEVSRLTQNHQKTNRVDTKCLPVRVGHVDVQAASRRVGIRVWDISCVRPKNDKITSFILHPFFCQKLDLGKLQLWLF